MRMQRGGRTVDMQDLTDAVNTMARGFCEAMNTAVFRGLLPRVGVDPETVNETIRHVAHEEAAELSGGSRSRQMRNMAMVEAALLLVEHPCADNGWIYRVKGDIDRVLIQRPADKTSGEIRGQ